jgi:hypothetical protein
MAITYRTSTAGGGSSGTSDRTGSAITPVVNDLFLVYGGTTFTSSPNTSPTCSDNNGGTYTLIYCVVHNTNDISYLFVRNQPLPNTTSTTVTVATGSNLSGEVVTVAFSGALKYGPRVIRQWANQAAQASGGTPTPAFSLAALTGNCTMWGVANGGAAGSVIVPNASWTERQDVGQTANAIGIEIATRDSGFTGTSVAAGGTSGSNFSSMLVELDGTADVTYGLMLLGVT